MAKTKERKALKKGKAAFNLIGRVKVTDKTFNLDNSYDSGWTDNSMYVGVDCGNCNIVYAEMRSGFFPDKDNVIRAYSKDEKDDAGKSKSVEIAWEDRLDESLYDSISDSSFLTVGVEKDVKDKTVYKKFLTAYDAVEYLNEHLEDGMIVNVKGTIGYSEYEGNVSTKKEITSIVLSKIDDEADFKATFSQTILVDSKSIGKKNDDKGTMELTAYVVDYVGKPKIDGEKIEVKKNVTYPKTFEVAINENPEITAKMLQRFFKPKKGKITEITVTGNLVEGGSTVNITEDDIPDDIKELIEMGLYSEEEAEKKIAVGNGNRERRMIIVKPDITYVGTGDDRKPTVAFEDGKYDEDDLYFYEQALLDAGAEPSSDDDTDSENEETSSEDDDLLAMLEGMN
nr:MAG TPA: Single strand DNA binding protein [Caudoviricetes sp.]DAI04260.1 MAG TPA: Single strand DNA binding protein [Caudoviricetes sp.]